MAVSIHDVSRICRTDRPDHDLLGPVSGILVRPAPGRGRVIAGLRSLRIDEEWRCKLDRFLVGRRLSLHPRKTRLIDREEPTEFLGFVLLPNGQRCLPEDNVRRFRNRLRGLRDRYRAGTVTREEVIARVNGWIGHALHGWMRFAIASETFQFCQGAKLLSD